MLIILHFVKCTNQMGVFWGGFFARETREQRTSRDEREDEKYIIYKYII